MINMLDLLYSAITRLRICLSPWPRFLPSTSSWKSRPYSFTLSAENPRLRSVETICLYLSFSIGLGEMFSAIVPSARLGFWDIKLNWLLSSLRSREDMSCPSISTVPDWASITLLKSFRKEVFPDPVLPTMPIFSPGSTSSETSLSTS